MTELMKTVDEVFELSPVRELCNGDLKFARKLFLDTPGAVDSVYDRVCIEYPELIKFIHKATPETDPIMSRMIKATIIHTLAIVTLQGMACEECEESHDDGNTAEAG